MVGDGLWLYEPPHHPQAVTVNRSRRHRAPPGRHLIPLAVEHLAHFAGEKVGPERLADEADSRPAQSLVKNCVFGIAGHEEHARVGSRLPELERELAAADVRHDDIGNQKVDRAAMGSAERERLLAVARDANNVAELLEYALQYLAQRITILDE